ncbi:MAG: hypothetical protein NT029_00765 [Armatimonadetes bacterium]|nr:hypothetical protein [Armatimonadota bacterium]
MKGVLTLRMLSDTCFSMPAALTAAVDSEVATDELGLPMVSGKTLRGLLRDTWLSMLDALGDEAEAGLALLGEPQSHGAESVLRISDARMDGAIRSRLAWALSRPQNPLPPSAVPAAFLGWRAQTSMDRVTGAPNTDTLRGIRVAPRRTVLTADLETSRDLTGGERRLLDLLAKATRHAGLDRNRGLGHIAMGVEWHATAQAPPVAPPAGVAATVVHYRLTLTAPALFRTEGSDPNSSVGLDFAPGSAIRGAVAAALTAAGRHDDVRSIIHSGRVRFLDATPEADGRRTVRAATTWRRDKGATLEDWDAQAKAGDMASDLADGRRLPRGVQRQPLGHRWWASSPIGLIPANPAMVQRTHQSRDRATASTDKDGPATVYVYEALAAGSKLQGAIAGPADLVETAMRTLETGPVWLGRSARAGYGGAPVVERLSTDGATGEIAGRLPGRIDDGMPFLVRLTSPAILRDPETGAHDPWQLSAAVEARFGGAAVAETAYVKPGSVRAYNRLWRTAMADAACAEAGSVVVMIAGEDLDSAALQRIEAMPLGERCADGLGCFVAEASWPARLPVQQEAKARAVDEADLPEDIQAGAVTQAQERLYSSVLRRVLAAYSIRMARGLGGDLPAPSQVHALRASISQAGLADALREWTEARGADGGPRANRTWLTALRHDTMPLSEFLRLCSQPAWRPPVPGESPQDGAQAAERRIYRFAAQPVADEAWDSALAGLGTWFIDQLLSAIAKRCKTGRGGAA